MSPVLTLTAALIGFAMIDDAARLVSSAETNSCKRLIPNLYRLISILPFIGIRLCRAVSIASGRCIEPLH